MKIDAKLKKLVINKRFKIFYFTFAKKSELS